MPGGEWWTSLTLRLISSQRCISPQKAHFAKGQIQLNTRGVDISQGLCTMHVSFCPHPVVTHDMLFLVKP